MFWIYKTEAYDENDARIHGRPEVLKEYNLHFGRGIRQSQEVPTIEIIIKKPLHGRLTDNLIAHGVRGLVINQKLKQLFDALEIDNVQYYPTIINNQVTNELIHDYQTVNIIGRIKCFDFEKSDFEIDEDDGSIRFIDKLVLDEKVIQQTDLKLFRPADFSSIVLAHESVKNLIEANNISGVSFYHPEEFVL